MTHANPHEAQPAIPAELPVLRVEQSSKDIIAKLTELAKRGKLPGFHVRGVGDGDHSLFEVEAWAVPFTGRLIARHEPSESGSKLTFSTEIARRSPLIWLVVLVLTIWPGYPLTESLIATIAPASWWPWTAWWYLPLSVISVPLAMLPGLKKSRAMAHASAHEAIEVIREALTAKA